MKSLQQHQRIKPKQGYGTITTTTIMKEELTPNKLEETHVINDESGRYNHAYEYPLQLY